MNPSQRWRLNEEDVKKWFKNTLVFLAPLGLIYFASIAPEIQDSGLQTKDFAISPIVAGAMVLYVVNVATDFLKKLVSVK
jgi:hypothetical protein